MLYDQKTNIIYAATSQGMYAYKQNHFTKLPTIPEQIGNSFFSLKQNQAGDIFFKNLNGQIFRITGNGYELFYETPNKDSYYNYHFLKNGNIIINTQKAITKITPQKESEILFKTQKETKIHNSIKNQNDVISFIYGNNGIIKFENDSISHIKVNFKNPFFTFFDNKLVAFSRKTGELQQVTTAYVPNFQKKAGEKYHLLKNGKNIALDRKKGMRFFTLENDTINASDFFFKDLFISTYYEANNGTLLLGTFGEGILIIPNPKIIKKNSNELFLDIATSPTNDVRIATRSGQLLKYKNNEFTVMDQSNITIDRVFYIPNQYVNSLLNQDGFIYPRIKYFFTKKYHLKTHYKYQFSNIKNVLTINDTSILISIGSRLALRSDHSRTEISSLKRHLSLAWNKADSTIYFCTNYGLFHTKWLSKIHQPINFQDKPFLCNDLKFEHHQLFCATKNRGVLIFQNNQFSHQLSTKNGLYDNLIFRLAIRDNNLFILSDKGLQIYNIKTKKLTDLGVKDGLITSGIKSFALSNDKIWLMEKNNVFSLELDDVLENRIIDKISKLRIDSVTVNGNKIDFSQTNRFDFNENRFNFYFDYRHIETKQETTISYALDGFYDEWKKLPSSENTIEFQSLPPGKYTFRIKANYQKQVTDTFVYTFKILPPFWQRWWFYLLIVVFISLVAFIFYWYRISQLKKEKEIALEKEKLSKNLAQSQLKTLKSQMNPHFIFNLLNSIQYLILKKETQKSYEFINKFAGLVRSTLSYSDKEEILLSEEINLLDTYLKLEKLRFGDGLEYEIEEENFREVSIPPMLIQPFIENALIHGLIHKEGLKKLKVIFKLDKVLTCIVLDNGIGREKAKNIRLRQRGGHESFSTQAIKRRFDILKAFHKEDLGFEYVDLIPENDEDFVTKVIIKIPIN